MPDAWFMNQAWTASTTLVSHARGRGSGSCHDGTAAWAGLTLAQSATSARMITEYRMGTSFLLTSV
jgi:hypothetical protein